MWGASAVLAGHEHLYERFVFNGLPYFVNGIGGKSLYSIVTPLPESIVHYNTNYGAMRITEYTDKLIFTEINVLGEEIDSYTLAATK